MRSLAWTLLFLANPAAAARPPDAGTPPALAVESPAERSAAHAEGAAIPSAAVLEKLGLGDRLFLAGDYRNALFAYQDAVYMQPKHAPARVKLGRAYLALRYATQAAAQAEAALAADPGSAEARKLLEDARSAPPSPAVVSASATAPQTSAAAREATAPAATAPAASAARAAPRVFRLTPDATAVARPEPSALEAAGNGPATPPGAESTPRRREAAEAHYRAGVAELQNREWAKALSELSSAISADPKLAVAYAARGSAYFGLGKYAQAADDYLSATLLDARMATPLYGLAECYRIAGDAPRAVEMYERYAASTASDAREDLRLTAARRAQELR